MGLDLVFYALGKGEDSLRGVAFETPVFAVREEMYAFGVLTDI